MLHFVRLVVYCATSDHVENTVDMMNSVTSASGLVPNFVLGLCLTLYVFYASSHVILEVLIIGSSRRLRPSHVLHPIGLQNNHLQIHLVQFSCVVHQTPKSKVNAPRVHFSYNLRLFGD